MFRFSVAVYLLLGLAHVAVGAEEKRDWQTGKVLDSQRSRYFAGTVGNANTTGTAQANGNYGTYQGNTNTTQTAVYRVYETFSSKGKPTHIWRKSGCGGSGLIQRTSPSTDLSSSPWVSVS